MGEEDATDIKNDDVEDVVNEDVMNNTEDVKNNEMEKKWKVFISEVVGEIKELIGFLYI